jgi:hypothetical protein
MLAEPFMPLKIGNYVPRFTLATCLSIETPEAHAELRVCSLLCSKLAGITAFHSSWKPDNALNECPRLTSKEIDKRSATSRFTSLQGSF